MSENLSEPVPCPRCGGKHAFKNPDPCMEIYQGCSRARESLLKQVSETVNDPQRVNYLGILSDIMEQNKPTIRCPRCGVVEVKL